MYCPGIDPLRSIHLPAAGGSPHRPQIHQRHFCGLHPGFRRNVRLEAWQCHSIRCRKGAVHVRGSPAPLLTCSVASHIPLPFSALNFTALLKQPPLHAHLPAHLPIARREPAPPPWMPTGRLPGVPVCPAAPLAVLVWGRRCSIRPLRPGHLHPAGRALGPPRQPRPPPCPAGARRPRSEHVSVSRAARTSEHSAAASWRHKKPRSKQARHTKREGASLQSEQVHLGALAAGDARPPQGEGPRCGPVTQRGFMPSVEQQRQPPDEAFRTLWPSLELAAWLSWTAARRRTKGVGAVGRRA